MKMTNISNFKIFPLIASSEIVNINELTPILKIIGHFEIKHITTLQIKNKRITSVLKSQTNIITNIADSPIGLALILVVMSVSTIKPAVTLYLIL